jgi:hypothetical protein
MSKKGREFFIGKYDVIFWTEVVKKSFDLMRSLLCISLSNVQNTLASGVSDSASCDEEAETDGKHADGSEQGLIREATFR